MKEENDEQVALLISQELARRLAINAALLVVQVGKFNKYSNFCLSSDLWSKQKDGNWSRLLSDF